MYIGLPARHSTIGPFPWTYELVPHGRFAAQQDRLRLGNAFQARVHLQGVVRPCEVNQRQQRLPTAERRTPRSPT
jgi:hypothetical protein